MPQEKEPQVGSDFLGRPVSRRSLLTWGLKGAAAAAAIATVGCESAPKKPAIEPSATPESVIETDGYEIFINGEGLPYKYRDSAGGETQFDMKLVTASRESALKHEEPEVVDLIPVPPSSFISSAISYSRDHPETSKLPDDVLSEVELKEHGIKIIQADNTTLSIRKGAFEEGGPLAQFDGKRKLIIAVLDAPAVIYSAAKDPKYDQVRKLLHEKEIYVKNYRFVKIAQIEEELNTLRKDASVKAVVGQDTLLSLKVLEYEYRHTVTDEQIAYEASVDTAEAAGQYFYPGISGIANTAVVFIAAGSYNRPSGLIRVFFDSNGNCQVDHTDDTEYIGSDYSPQASQTYPDPLKFRFNKNAKADIPRSYPYGGQTAGQILRHELEHDELITEQKTPNFSEYQTDINAMEEIRNARFLWQESGYKDNSGYCFVFSLNDGGYILTEGEEKLSGNQIAA